MHDGVTWLVLHGDPHDPQFDESLRVFDSHPSVALLLLQSENPLRHGPEHTPPEHKGVTLLLEQVMPHDPQLSARHRDTHTHTHTQTHTRVIRQRPSQTSNHPNTNIKKNATRSNELHVRADESTTLSHPVFIVPPQ